jgi:hypothetical protein
LQVKLQIIEGPFKNRTIIDRFNLWNKNPAATTIAQQQFKKVCEAVNIPKPPDSSSLHMKPLVIKVAVKEYNGSNQNEVKGYKAVTASSAAPVVTATTTKPGGW